MEISFEGCKAELVTTPAAVEDLRKWENRSYIYHKAGSPALARQQDQFRDYIKAFVHREFFEVASWDVTDTLKRTEHALGDLEKIDDEHVLTEEAAWPFSFSYYLHSLLEAKGRLPLWQELWHAAWFGEFRPYYRDAMPDVLRLAADKLNRPVDLSDEQMERSAHWRLGKYYYSALRELYLHASLRERFQIRLRYHLFADVRLFVDGWTPDGALLCLRLRNWRESRKGRPETWIPPGFRVIRAGTAFGRRGRGWLPSDEQVAEVAQLIKTSPSL